MGGYPPVDGLYSEMLRVTKATHEMTIHPEKAAAANADSEGNTAEFTLSEGQARQFLQRFSDERRLRSLTVAAQYRARKQAASSIKRKPL
jgi:hypothetical protein